MKILGIIPARGGSKGVPGKNIKHLGGRPLLAFTFDSAANSKYLSKIILSSDSEEIINVARDMGMDVPFTRPAELAKDETPSIEVIKHSLEFFQNKGEYFDAVCLLQPTSPFRKNGLIDEAVEKFISDDYDSVISVREVPAKYNPHWIFEENDDSLKLATGENQVISRRQDLPKAYFRDGAIYLIKTQIILEENSLYGDKIGFIDTTISPYVNIDSLEDWIAAEKFLANGDE